MTDEQTKELLTSLSSISWHLKRIADLEEEKRNSKLTAEERIKKIESYERLKQLMKRSDNTKS